MMMRTIMNNKERFISLIKSIPAKAENITAFLNKLENSDFYTAPASTRYHHSYEGGLLEHSLNVYDNLCKLNEMMGCGYSDDTLKIVGLLHDISKMNFYEEYIQNKKVYSPSGTKHDNLGNFEWISEPAYKVKDAENRFVFGYSGQTSEFMIRTFFDISYIESAALMQTGLGSDIGFNPDVMGAYPLACLLYTADMLDMYIAK